MKNTMKALDKPYEKPSSSHKIFLMKHLFNIKVSKGRFISNHLNEFNATASQLSSIGVNFDDEVRDIFILCSLLEIWNVLVMAE
jgi:hypothetical protein